MAEQKTIHKEMTIDEILSLFPHKAQKLSYEISRAGLHCIGCQASTWETLEAGMMGHGMGELEINTLVERLNTLLEEPVAERNSINLTPRAAEKFLEVAKEDKKEKCALRFGDRMAGCSGYEYELDFSEGATENDAIFHSQGIEIHVEKAKIGRLMGSTIDYVDGLRGSGFKVENPNVRASCGCGSSHGY